MRELLTICALSLSSALISFSVIYLSVHGVGA